MFLDGRKNDGPDSNSNSVSLGSRLRCSTLSYVLLVFEPCSLTAMHTPPNLKLSLISKITPGFFPWQELTLSVPGVGTALNVTCWKKDQDRLYSRDQTSVFLNVLVKYYALHWAFYIVTVFDTCYSDCSDHHTSLSKNVAIWFFLLLSLASFEDMLFFTLFILIVQWLCLGCWQCCDTCSEFRS